MKVLELYHLLRSVINANVDNGEKEIRIGDQIEAGPYSHSPVGGVYLGTWGEVIICADPDTPATDEESMHENLPVLWAPKE